MFFSIFDLARHATTRVTAFVDEVYATYVPTSSPGDRKRVDATRVARATTLVSGGVVAGLGYELVSRPWDHARRTVQVYQLAARFAPAAVKPQKITAISAAKHILRKAREDGVISFFRNPDFVASSNDPTPRHRRLYVALRTLARVGPWGVAFLVWESVGVTP